MTVLSAPSVMAGEIAEIPQRTADLLATADQIEAVAGCIRRRAPRWAVFAGRGTSDHAATYGRYLAETQLGLPAGLAAPSVSSLYGRRVDLRDGLVVAVSQSGQSPDIVAVVEQARHAGAVTVALVNDAFSPLAGAADLVIDCRAGVERSVAATKSYVNQLLALALLVESLARQPGRFAWASLPALLSEVLAAAAHWLGASGAADELAERDRALVASRGHNLATALEVALKLRETSAMFADGYSMADLLHGPVAAASPSTPAIVLRPDGAVGEALDDGIERLVRAGVRPWLIGGAGLHAGLLAAGRWRGSERWLALPTDALPEWLTPLALVLPGQLLAESVAVRRGLDPDHPAGLSKVTLTR